MDSRDRLPRVTLVDDDNTTGALMSSAFQLHGFAVDRCSSAAQALLSMDSFKPDAIVVDLDLGPGPTGLDVVRAARAHGDGIPAVILSNHRSPIMVESSFQGLPEGVPYLVKDDLVSAEAIIRVVESLIAGRPLETEVLEPAGVLRVSRTQAALLHQMAQGMTNAQIAEARGSTVRAVERLCARTYDALGIDPAAGPAARVRAVQLYQDGVILVDE